jgi:hypothetical protein
MIDASAYLVFVVLAAWGARLQTLPDFRLAWRERKRFRNAENRKTIFGKHIEFLEKKIVYSCSDLFYTSVAI